MGDASKSKLSDYGFDFVLATTQRSINATMKQFLSGLDNPTTVVYYARDINNPDKEKRRDPLPITAEELKKRLATTKYPNGIDVFSIPDKESEDPRVTALAKAGFKCAFRITLGIPPHFKDKSKIPDIVTLGSNTKSVNYKMYCKDFEIVHYENQDGDVYWKNLSQNREPTPWTFVSNVDMRLNAVDSAFKQADLPEPVKNAIKNLSDTAFSIQQLLLDLSSATLQSAPEIDGIDNSSEALVLLRQFFLSKYWGEMKKGGTPTLNYTVKRTPQTATLAPTDLDFMVEAYVGSNGKAIEKPSDDQKAMATLNYLCMTEGKKFPGINSPFPWNWVDMGQARDFDGVVSINRRTFVDWFLRQIEPCARNACFVPHVNVSVKPFGQIGCNYKTWRTSDVALNIVKPALGARVLDISWDKSDYDCAGLDGALGSLRYGNTYKATVDFSGNTITCVVHGTIAVRLKVGQSWNEANVVDKTWTTVWTLGVDGKGKVKVTEKIDEKDDSKTDSVNAISDLFTSANSIFNDLRQSNLASIPFGPFPFRALVDFVFPGGRSFAFKNFKFSDNQDLLVAITYTDPNSN